MLKKKLQKKPTLTISQIGIFSSFQLIQKLSPRLAAFFAFKLWFRPGRSILKRIPTYQPLGMKANTFKIANKTIHYYSAGMGPVILLVHGWASFGSHLANFAKALLEQGYQVVWFDAPAHGASSGKETNLYEISESIHTLEKLTGSFRAVIGHSFGALSTFVATNQGLSPEKIIAISSPSSGIDQVNKFFGMLKIKPKTQKHFFHRLYQIFDKDAFQAIDAEVFGVNIKQPVLIIHDQTDKIIPLSEARVLDKNLVNSQFILTTGLGHNKILHNAKVIQDCLHFIQEED